MVSTPKVAPDWNAQLVRLTVFLRAPLSPDSATTIWREAVGQDPVIDENRPREGTRRQSGPYAEGQLEAQVQAARVDWLMTVAPPSDVLIPPLHFARLEPALKSFGAVVRPWLETFHIEITRLAVGAVFIERVADKIEAYERLKSFLKAVEVDPLGTSDLFYQINRPIDSRVVSSLKLNRITKWSAMQYQLLEGASLIQTGQQATRYIEEQYVRLDCDHNTDQFHTDAFDIGLRPALYDELVGLIRLNAEEGEI